MPKKKVDKAIQRALKHSNKLGAGAKKRRKLSPKKRTTAVLKEFKRGTLHSGSGRIVTNPKQAIAIGLSEARKNKKRRKR